MNTGHHRKKIISILLAKRYTTARKLAEKFHVSMCTIRYEIQALSFGYPIYAKLGENGGIFIEKNYKPYANSLTHRIKNTV